MITIRIDDRFKLDGSTPEVTVFFGRVDKASFRDPREYYHFEEDRDAETFLKDVMRIHPTYRLSGNLEPVA